MFRSYAYGYAPLDQSIIALNQILLTARPDVENKRRRLRLARQLFMVEEPFAFLGSSARTAKVQPKSATIFDASTAHHS